MGTSLSLTVAYNYAYSRPISKKTNPPRPLSPKRKKCTYTKSFYFKIGEDKSHYFKKLK